MNWIWDLLTNPLLITAVSSWAIAQVIKVIIHAIICKTFDIGRLFGDGGMPSGHSATVVSLALISGLIYGLGSFEFAVTAILAIVVCHDATGVRQETGKQAVVINDLVRAFEALTTDDLAEVKLKEFVGHTPVQVLAGALLGVFNAVGMYFLLI